LKYLKINLKMIFLKHQTPQISGINNFQKQKFSLSNADWLTDTLKHSHSTKKIVKNRKIQKHQAYMFFVIIILTQNLTKILRLLNTNVP